LAISTECSLDQQESALKVMQRHPKLAAEYINGLVHCLETRYTPLAFFVQVAASGHTASFFASNTASPGLTREQQQQQHDQHHLSLIHRVYELYPESLSMRDLRGRVPLHEACALSAPFIIIKFIAQQNPAAAGFRDKCNLFPLHLAIRGARRASRDLLQMLLDLNPDAFNYPDFGGELPLVRALKDEHDAPVLKLMYETWLKYNSEPPFNTYRFPRDIPITLDVAKGLSIILSSLRSLTLWRSDATMDGMNFLLESLILHASNKGSMVELDLELLRSIFNEVQDHQLQSSRAYKSFIRKLFRPSSLQRLTLRGQFRDNLHGYDNPAFQTINKGINCASVQCRLQKLSLRNFRLGIDYQSNIPPLCLLQDVLLSPFAPVEIDLESLEIECHHTGPSIHIPPMKSGLERSSLERLTVRHCSGDWVYHVLQKFVPAESPLKKLALICCVTGDDTKSLSEPLAHLIEQTRLEHLDLFDLYPNGNEQEIYLPITRALARNSHLKHYSIRHRENTEANFPVHEANMIALREILETWNTTLQYVAVDIEFCKTREDSQQIQYLTRLNKKGRGEARNLQTNRARFVQLLAATNDAVVQYGLLRESPSIWCDCLQIMHDNQCAARKNKRQRL